MNRHPETEGGVIMKLVTALLTGIVIVRFRPLHSPPDKYFLKILPRGASCSRAKDA